MDRKVKATEILLDLTRALVGNRLAMLASAAMQPETLTSEQMLSILEEFEELRACVH